MKKTFDLLKETIDKYELERTSTYLDEEEKPLMFGYFVKGHPMIFEGNFEDMVKEVNNKIDDNYVIKKNIIFDDNSGLIVLCLKNYTV